MQVVFHIGVHATDGDRMLKTLLNNRAALLKQGCEVVTPNRHRGLFEQALASLHGGPATPDMEQLMLDSVLDGDTPQRVVFTTTSFMGPPARAVGASGLYPQAGARMAALANLFPSARAEFFVAIRNPAALLGEIAAEMDEGTRTALVASLDPDRLRWLPVVQKMAQAVQGRRLVVWCHEDVALIWPDVVRLVGGLSADQPLAGGLLYAHEILGDEGLPKLRGALSGREGLSVAARREIFAQVLGRHARPEALDQPVDLPGWTQATVDRVTAAYHADVPQIAVLPGVEFVMA